MRITVHHDSFYDWEPVPKDVPTDTSDFKKAIDAKRVKPGSGGEWLMRVTKKKATHTDISMPESQLIAMVIHEMNRGDKVPLNRLECVASYLSRHVMDHHAHKNWMTSFEVHDDGPDEAQFDARLAEQVAAGNIEAEDLPELKAAYMTPTTSEDHVAHLHKHYRIKSGAA